MTSDQIPEPLPGSEPVEKNPGRPTKLKWFRRLYDWVLSWAESRYATLALTIHATTESFIFPIPVDPLLMALSLSKPRRALYFAFIASLFSVLGGLVGYAIGLWAYEAIGSRIIAAFHAQETFLTLQTRFNEYTFWAIMAAGLTPLPFKVFTIAAGACSVSMGPFLVGAVVSRSVRFFAVAGLIRIFGPAIKEKIDRYFDLFSVIFIALLIGGFLVLKYARH
ncbi:MAG: DedA family protein [Candidatus Bipolaricaulota bacterium]|nr:MAG: DedA family protein [Candidatus Bipolaricaulota bacterium]